MFPLEMGYVVGDGQGTQLPGVFNALIRVRSEDTNGVMAVVEETIPPRPLIPPHTHENDVWVYVLSGLVGVLGDQIEMAAAGSWALKPRSVMHAMWNPESESARIIEVLTPAGTERWFEEVTQLVDGDDDGFRDTCDRYGIRFLAESPWTELIRDRFGVG